MTTISRRYIHHIFTKDMENLSELSKDISSRLESRLLREKKLLRELCKRPTTGITEVRRDGKDTEAMAKIITAEFNRCINIMSQPDFVNHMHVYVYGCWCACESIHLQQLEDEKPENERERMDPDHWFENNLTNATLFANLAPEKIEGMQQLVPGRLFTTRMPRDIVEDLNEKQDFIDKCKQNKLKVICVLTETEEFKKYSGMDGLLDFYKNECGLIVYNRAIPDFKIPTSGDLVNNILDLTYHLSQGRNCLIHCAGGTGRTGMVVAAVIQNLGVYDAVNRIRKVKSTYVETPDQELFLKNMPKAIDSRIVKEKPYLARAIAAEQLIQVFHTNKGSIMKAGTEEEKEKARMIRSDTVDQLDDEDEEKLKGAYGQTFDLIDEDKSGCLEGEELKEWFAMVGAEINFTEIVYVLLGEGKLTRTKFCDLMSSLTISHRRDYDIGGVISSHH